MNDPHVTMLEYSFVTNEGVTYKGCQEVIHEEKTHSFVLRDGMLQCSFTIHFPDILSARNYIEPFLRAWEIHSALQMRKKEFHFRFSNADIVDRCPEPPSPHKIMVGGSVAEVKISATAHAHITRLAYPVPPSNFEVNKVVNVLWERFEKYLEGKEPLLSMAYFCLTYMESIAGTRKRIGAKYSIPLNVLNKLGELTAKEGDELTARKGKGHKLTPLSLENKQWIEATIRLLIEKAGEVHYLSF